MKKPITIALLIIFPIIAYGECNDRLRVERSLSYTSYGFTKEKDIVKAGKFSQRFELRAGDCASTKGWSDCYTDRSRSEVTAEKTISVDSVNYIRFNLYLPTDFQTSRIVKTTMGQIHQRGGPTGTAGGHPAMFPLLQFDARGDTYSMCWHANVTSKNTCRTYDVAHIDSLKGKWTEILLELNTSPSTGYAKVFVNNELKVDIVEPLFTHIPKEFYFKYGIYNSFISRNVGPMPTQIAYYDEVQIVNSKDKLCKGALD
jgi:hypothetical protein